MTLEELLKEKAEIEFEMENALESVYSAREEYENRLFDYHLLINNVVEIEAAIEELSKK